jgi:hypothetical protein
LMMIPFFFLTLLGMGRLDQWSFCKILPAVAKAFAIFCLIFLPHLGLNLHRYGSITSTQEQQVIHRESKTQRDILKAASRISWGRFFKSTIYPSQYWTGGWSFLFQPRQQQKQHQWIMWFVLGCGVVGLIARGFFQAYAKTGIFPEKNRLINNSPGWLMCGMGVFFAVLGMAYHAMASFMVLGYVGANPWYFMVAFPMMICLILQAVKMIHPLLMIGVAWGLGVLYLYSEIQGVLKVMPEFYASTMDSALMWERIGQLHPFFPHPDFRFWLLGGIFMILSTMTWCFMQTYYRDRHGTG